MSCSKSRVAHILPATLSIRSQSVTVVGVGLKITKKMVEERRKLDEEMARVERNTEALLNEEDAAEGEDGGG